MWRAVLSWLVLTGCGPVMLGEEVGLPTAGSSGSGGGGVAIADGAVAMQDSGMSSVGSGDTSDVVLPVVVVGVQPIGCGPCFELFAEAFEGRPPYAFEWDDGSRLAQRRACVGGAIAAFSVVAIDAAGVRSAPHTIRLAAASDASCADAGSDVVQPRLCLDNLSLEGTPAANFGGEMELNAPPWNACINPEVPNTPDIGNATVALTSGAVPEPTDGVTYLALGEGEQISQALCSDVRSGDEVYLQLDLARINIGDGVVPQTEQVFLEIWSGLSVDCMLSERLWASEALELGWKTYCVTLRPTGFMTQLTLRANADMTQLSPAYLVVDNLRAVDACP